MGWNVTSSFGSLVCTCGILTICLLWWDLIDLIQPGNPKNKWALAVLAWLVVGFSLFILSY